MAAKSVVLGISMFIYIYIADPRRVLCMHEDCSYSLRHCIKGMVAKLSKCLLVHAKGNVSFYLDHDPGGPALSEYEYLIPNVI